MSHSLATSSLLQAVGVHPGAAGTAGATAAVKWITKDGIGAFGRLLVSRSPDICSLSASRDARSRLAVVSMKHRGTAAAIRMM